MSDVDRMGDYRAMDEQPDPDDLIREGYAREAALVRRCDEKDAEIGRLTRQLAGAVDPMRESRIARARGLAQAISECRDDARLDGIREGAAEIVTLLGEQ